MSILTFRTFLYLSKNMEKVKYSDSKACRDCPSINPKHLSGYSIVKVLSGLDLTRSLISGIKGLRIGFLGTCLGLLSHNNLLGKVAPRC